MQIIDETGYDYVCAIFEESLFINIFYFFSCRNISINILTKFKIFKQQESCVYQKQAGTFHTIDFTFCKIMTRKEPFQKKSKRSALGM